MTVPLVALIPIVAFAGTGDVVGDPAVEPVAQQGPQTAIAALIAADLGRSLALNDMTPQLAAPAMGTIRKAVVPAPQRLSSPRGGQARTSCCSLRTRKRRRRRARCRQRRLTRMPKRSMPTRR